MRAFIGRHLDPTTRLGEILFALVMALGFTASVRFGLAEADNRELFVGILGCNLAWAIIDGVMYTLTELFERGRMAHLLRQLRVGSAPQGAERWVEEFEDRLGLPTTAEDRRKLEAWVLEVARHRELVPPGLRRDDLLGGFATALLILLTTLPLLVPFLLISNPHYAVRASNGVALASLFWVGMRWGQMVGGRAWLAGAGVMAIGVVLVLLTVALGG